ncbi:alpha-galactosidase [Microbacterium sp.]|uniref:alpha-galactosidase n=1 Tax=Microbacterium sp. TaxID=51671 RepID=UPI0039E5C2D6
MSALETASGHPTRMDPERRARAERPPMGWNSWDCFGGSVTEAEVLANAEYLAENLRGHGWDTVVVDIQWYEPDPGTHDYREASDAVLDQWGRPLPAPGRFPSAAGGSFRPLADRVHALGLRFGVHLMRGVPRRAVERGLPVLGTDVTCADIADETRLCPWNPDNVGVDVTRPGGQEYYDSLMALLAEWAVDFVKLDDVLYPPVESAEIAAVSRAIDRSGRPMVLSLSPGRELSLAHLEEFRDVAQMWRISDDFWDDWGQLREQFQRAARWAPHQRPGAWADADMLPLGRIGIRAHVGGDRLSRFSLDEQRTLLTLWCLLRSPLMFGGHLPDTPADTLELLTNETVLSLLGGEGSREIIRDGDLVAWEASVSGRAFRAVFWLGDEPRAYRAHFADLGLTDAARAEDVWTGEELPIEGAAVPLTVPAHGVRLIAFD